MYLVTGGCGFIGSHIAQRLINDGHDVRIADDLSSGKIENISDFKNDVEFFKIDIRDKEKLKSVMNGVDGVFHQAALVSVLKSVEDPELNHSININGTFNVLQSAYEAGVEKVVMASSAAVYGNGVTCRKEKIWLRNPIPHTGFQNIQERYTAVCTAGCSE